MPVAGNDRNATGAVPPSPPPPPSVLGLGGSRVDGDAFAIGAAACYALYEVLYKRGLGESGSADTGLVHVATGLVGCCSILVAAPGFPALHCTGVETLELPTVEVALWLGLNAGLALVYNACLMLAVAALSPLTTSVGCMLTIPLASLVDYLWHATPFTGADAGGAALIVAGFAGLLLADSGKQHAAATAGAAETVVSANDPDRLESPFTEHRDRR